MRLFVGKRHSHTALRGADCQIHAHGILALRVCRGGGRRHGYNVKLTIIGPETEEDYEAQNAMVERAVQQKAEAIVFRH